MIQSNKKTVVNQKTIGILILGTLYFFLLPSIFFWGYYIQTTILALTGVYFIYILILALYQYISSMRVANKRKRKKGKRNKILDFVLPAVLFISVVSIAGIVIRYPGNTLLLLTKDIPYVLEKKYVQIDGYVIDSQYHHSYRGGNSWQEVTAIIRKDNSKIVIRFEHNYKIIDKSKNYAISYLPNSNLGVSAEETP
jgi:hypothetical protein